MLFIALLAAGIGFATKGVYDDLTGVGEVLAWATVGLLGLALLIALGFEFVNGFHDTANAVATVIYTHCLPPMVAVVWSGCLQLPGRAGVHRRGGLRHHHPAAGRADPAGRLHGAGYAMIFALLIAAIVWNLGTWALGIPNSSSHALIGSIMGVGLANQLMAPAGQATSGVDWSQAAKVGQALLFSPLLRLRRCRPLLLLAHEGRWSKNRTLYEAPKSEQPPPLWIRGLLILTCTGVSFAHGGNDGQKGMGLIMLILIGAAPDRLCAEPRHAGQRRRRPSSRTVEKAQAGLRRP